MDLKVALANCYDSYSQLDDKYSENTLMISNGALKLINKIMEQEKKEAEFAEHDLLITGINLYNLQGRLHIDKSDYKSALELYEKNALNFIKKHIYLKSIENNILIEKIFDLFIQITICYKNKHNFKKSEFLLKNIDNYFFRNFKIEKLDIIVRPNKDQIKEFKEIFTELRNDIKIMKENVKLLESLLGEIPSYHIFCLKSFETYDQIFTKVEETGSEIKFIENFLIDLYKKSQKEISRQSRIQKP